MKKPTKRFKEYQKAIDKLKNYSLKEAMSTLHGLPHAKFDETVEMAFKLDVDTSKGPQSVRGTAALPHGTGKKTRVVVFCKPDQEPQAKEAGADFVGDKELIDKIASGWLEFDVVISTPDMMKDVSRLGKTLGPRGLMPSPKSGTVTTEISKAIQEVKAGKIEFKMDKQSNIFAPIGKISFGAEKLFENSKELLKCIIKAKPTTAKGVFIKAITISSTQGPGLKIDTTKIE